MSIRLCSDFFVGRARAVARVRRAVVVLLAGLLTVWLLPTQAWAAAPSDGSATADSADAAEAYEHYLRAYKLASASAYEEALKELQQALEKGAPKEGPKHYPDYLFATAKVYGRLNRHIEAVAYYERYLQLSSPDAPNRAKAESELQGERAKLAPLAGEPLFPPTLSTSVAALPSGEGAADAGAVEHKKEAPQPPLYRRPWFLAAVGGGVATIIFVSIMAAQPWRPHYENPVAVQF